MSEVAPPATPAASSASPPRPRPSSLREQAARFPTTYGLMGFTILVFLGQLLSDQLLGVDLILIYGAKVNEAIAAGEWWRLLTPLFVHGGVGHIFVNMYSLYAIGPAVERFYGARRTLALYLLSGVGGVILSLALSPYPSIGASGAIFGLLGALGAFLYRHRALFGRLGRVQLRQIVLVALLNLGLGLMPGIDNWGHMGGLLAGLALAWFMGPHYVVEWLDPEHYRARDQRPWREVWPRAILAAAALGLLALLAVSSPFSA